MILPDVNVLIYAFRRDTPHHALCHSWLSEIVASDARYGMSRLALSALVRIATNSCVFREPSTLAEAFKFCDAMTAQPNCQIIEPGERHWGIFQGLCTETRTQGPRVTDAWFAALAMEWGCEWVTLDRDYNRFPGLKWSVPG